MNKKYLKKAWKWFQVIFLAYMLIGVALYYLQDTILFRSKKLPADYQYKFDIPFNQADLAVNDKKKVSIVQFTVPDSIRKGIVLYFHGNRENINRYAKYATNFTRNKYEVWMIDYPGYGKSTGTRSEQIMYDDAALLYKMAISKVSLEHIIIYGKSLGTGIAAQLASVKDCKRLILETPYYSYPAVAKQYLFIYPVDLAAKYSFPTYQYFENIKAPITIFHGTNDKVIFYKQAKWLTEKKPGTELITIEKGGHNNLPAYRLFHEKLDSLLSL